MTLFHMLINLLPTCGEICLQILDDMVSKKQFLFSTDSYHSGSTIAREVGVAAQRKSFLANDDNKKQLCQLMLRVWSSSSAVSRLEKTEMAMLIVEGRAHQLVTLNGQVR